MEQDTAEETVSEPKTMESEEKVPEAKTMESEEKMQQKDETEEMDTLHQAQMPEHPGQDSDSEESADEQ